jgi:hypothetical protein
MEDVHYYKDMAENNPSIHYKKLEDMITESAKKGLYHIEFDLSFYGWFEQAHVELLKDKGFVVSVFELPISCKSKYVCIKWSDRPVLTRKPIKHYRY